MMNNEVHRKDTIHDIKNIRVLEIPFNKVLKTIDGYQLIESGLVIATVSSSCLNDATKSKLDSLSEYRI